MSQQAAMAMGCVDRSGVRSPCHPQRQSVSPLKSEGQRKALMLAALLRRGLVCGGLLSLLCLVQPRTEVVLDDGIGSDLIYQ